MLSGKLKARFDVDLGIDMFAQLQAYLKASFALSKIHVRMNNQQKEEARAPCVEVELTEEARDLYADKHPSMASKRRQQRRALADVHGEVDADATSTEAFSDVQEGESSAASRSSRILEETPPATTSRPAPVLSPAKAPSRRSTKRPPSGETVSPTKRRCAAPGSVWEACEKREVPGVEGLREARDALEAGHMAQGLTAPKAEKEAVSWLKGLAAREVSIDDLKSTMIGQAVNLWRKHTDPYISGLAFALLRDWKAAWKFAEEQRKLAG